MNLSLRLICQSLVVAILILPIVACADTQDRAVRTSSDLPVKELMSLNATIARADFYQNRREVHLDSLKRNLTSGRNKLRDWEILHHLCEDYRLMNSDSAMYYATMAKAIAPSDSLNAISALSLANALSTSGLFVYATNLIDSIRQTHLSPELKISLWTSSRILYSCMMNYVHGHSELTEKYRKSYIECDDSLLSILPPDNKFHQFIFCERLVNDGQYDRAKRLLERLMSTTTDSDNLHAMSAFQLAKVYHNLDDDDNFVSYLAIASECDIKNSVKEGLALTTLANWLYKTGDIDNAFKYINFALDEANNSNSRMRTVGIASSMPMIDEAYRNKIDKSNNKMLAYSVFSTSLFILLGILLVALFRYIRQSKIKERKLATTSRKLEEYMGNFIAICSGYASRFDQLTKLVNRKLSSGQTEELKKILNSGKFSEADNSEFYRLIDKALLDILPSFINDINTLLLEDKKIESTPNSTLTPELRIYAFVRLGVDQSARIAQILDYSVNTVYAYRNRMRNRAIDRDNFDANVSNLGNMKIDNEF